MDEINTPMVRNQLGAIWDRLKKTGEPVKISRGGSHAAERAGWGWSRAWEPALLRGDPVIHPAEVVPMPLPHWGICSGVGARSAAPENPQRRRLPGRQR